MAYASLSFPDNPLPGMCALLAAYCSECGPLTPLEIEHLPVSLSILLSLLNLALDSGLCSLERVNRDGRLLHFQGPH
jgi:hypothetical protein